MIQCKDCEFFVVDSEGRRSFSCDPFTNVKEPECLAKWQLMRLDMLLASYQGMLRWYGKLAPMQDKLFKYMEREIDEMEQADGWKLDYDQESEPDTDADTEPDDPYSV